jgi:plasmid stabilization system protein ParE
VKSARLAPEAEAELREAAAWYRESAPDVARRFLAEVRMLARAIARKPLRFPVLVDPAVDPPVTMGGGPPNPPAQPVRRALMPGFPYALVFVVGEDVVHVLAVAHQHRAPGYWLYRVGQKR